MADKYHQIVIGPLTAPQYNAFMNFIRGKDINAITNQSIEIISLSADPTTRTITVDTGDVDGDIKTVALNNKFQELASTSGVITLLPFNKNRICTRADRIANG